MTEVLKGVMKLYESKNSKTYRIMCDCIGKDCDMYMEFEIDNDTGMIFLSFGKTLVWSSYYGETTWYERTWTRIKKSALILFRGYIEVEESHIIQSIEHMENFRKVMDEGLEFLKLKQEENKNGNG